MWIKRIGADKLIKQYSKVTSRVTGDGFILQRGTNYHFITVEDLIAGVGTGTVGSVAVADANGFYGTVANSTTAPVITIRTTVTGLLKGNGTSISAATPGTDYLVPNGAITGATKTKITYDANGFVTSGTDATTADIADTTNKRYQTDNQQTYNDATSSIQTQLGTKLTSLSVINANGVSASSSGGVTPALTFTLGAITPTSVNGNTITTGTGTLNLSTYTLTVAGTSSIIGANTGDQTIFGRSGNITAQANDYSFSQLSGIPTTVAGYGITDVYTKTSSDARYLLLSGGALSGALTLSGLPTSALHAATKSYVDNAVDGLKFKIDCVAASIANVSISSAPSSLDSVSLTLLDRLLLKNQTDATENGAYIFNGAGNALTRATDSDTGSELISATFPIRGGTTNQDTWWTVTNDTITIGVTNIVFSQTGGAGTYTNGSGITLTGNVFSISAGAITNSMLANSSVTIGSTSVTLGTAVTTFVGLASVTSTTFVGALTGNSTTTTALANPRNINGVAFDGTGNITVTAAAGTLSGATLAAGVTASSLTSFGNSPVLVTPALGVASSTSLSITGTGGNGYISLVTQASDPSAPAGGTVIFSNSTSKLSWRGSVNNFVKTFDGSAATASRIYSLPDVAGTVALIDGGQTFTSAVWNGTIVTGTYGGTGINNGTKTITLAGNLVTSGAFNTTLTLTADSNATIPAGTNTLYSTLSGSITSAQLLTSLTNATGTGVAVFGTSPAITTSITTASTTFALINTTATTVNFAGGASAALNVGHASGTNTILGVTTFSQAVTLSSTVNKVTITAPATAATLTIANNKTLTCNASITFAGTDATTMNFPSTTATIARTDVGQTFNGNQTFLAASNVANTQLIDTSGTTGNSTLTVENTTNGAAVNLLAQGSATAGTFGGINRTGMAAVKLDVQSGGVGYVYVSTNFPLVFGTNNVERARFLAGGTLVFAAGTTTTCPVQFTSAALKTSNDIAGDLQFLTDKFYGTINTGTAVKEFTMNNGALTSGRVPFATTNGRLNDNAAFLFDTTSGLQFLGTTTNNSATAGNVGEYISGIQSTYTNYTTTVTYQNITSIALTAGDWDIWAFATFSSNAATITAAGNAIFVISTTTASAAGSTEGKNISYVPQAALLGTSFESILIPPYQISISGTTTYYLNTQAAFTIGNPQFVGTIIARRRR